MARVRCLKTWQPSWNLHVVELREETRLSVDLVVRHIPRLRQLNRVGIISSRHSIVLVDSMAELIPCLVSLLAHSLHDATPARVSWPSLAAYHRLSAHNQDIWKTDKTRHSVDQQQRQPCPGESRNPLTL